MTEWWKIVETVRINLNFSLRSHVEVESFHINLIGEIHIPEWYMLLCASQFVIFQTSEFRFEIIKVLFHIVFLPITDLRNGPLFFMKYSYI